jgi:hypothetical protein
MEKRLGPFDVQKVPESQKTCKSKEICHVVSKPNQRGLFRKSPIAMENMLRSLINYQITKNIT